MVVAGDGDLIGYGAGGHLGSQTGRYRALQAFRLSCPSLMRRTDASGLTRGSDWNNSCAAASSWPDASASEFFSRYFEAVQVGDGAAFVTGYYEPEIAGSRTRHRWPRSC